ncbi:hypothetical protein cce_2294 [Crocosphaera subtropica ATCC 51142]|uniref:Glycosyltransferase RgtA/B/C/D-like domain-containing protein n=1 Tax=Crocosphaera subtropica (strain ATCC 51142 / BH68) TaxID=43989 RepID=B1WQD3_CROS5|nr:hypothetical protein [Crocosphaera subtropica]ACB51644.1 hypothetical protein cce_2294 [Crocosphaera subtropica ATCC 51142]
MKSNHSARIKDVNNHQNAETSLNFFKIFLLLAIVIGITDFLYFTRFGLYEDDYSRIPFAMEAGWIGSGSGLGRFILNNILIEQGQGRPFHDILIVLFSWIGNKLGGFHSIYLIGYFIITINAFLFYTLLKRLTLPNIFIFTSVLAFALFPADTTQPFLTHSLGIQPSITFLLIALNCYVSGKKKLSYLVILGSLLSYEPMFPVFLAAPLLKNKWDLRLYRKLIKHTLLMAFIVVFVIFIRQLSGETRASDVDIVIAFQTVVSHMIIGPIVSLKMFVYRLFTTLKGLNLKSLLIIVPSWIGLFWIFSTIKANLSEQSKEFIPIIRIGTLRLKITEDYRLLLKFLLIGILMTVLAYPFALSSSASIINGRSSKVHAAAVVGASMVCACVCSAIWFIANQYGKKYVGTALLATFLALLMGFGLLVQQDYVLSWQYQRAFWTDIDTLCADMTENTVILVDNHNNLRGVKQIQSFFERPSLVMSHLYQFPKDWKPQPKLYYLRENWQDNIVSDKNLWQLNSITTTAPGLGYGALKSVDRSRYYTNTESENIILLQAKTDKLDRVFSVVIDDQVFPLKQKPNSTSPSLTKGVIYQYMIQDSQKVAVNYIK